MFWYIIGWILSGLVTDMLTGLVSAWVMFRRGYDLVVLEDAVMRMKIRCLHGLTENSPWIVCIANGLFNSIFWPVDILRYIFLDIPDAIEAYKSQQNNEELA